MPRQPSQQIQRSGHIYLPLQDDSDEYEWYWEDDGGGFTMRFGMHRNDKLRDISFNYLEWCRRVNAGQSVRGFQSAFQKYYTGLEGMVEDHYARFIVPFGATYNGKMIGECWDKPWLVWASGKSVLTDKFPLFFRAVARWLSLPNHQMATRDIGELLAASRYNDDLGNTDCLDDEYEKDDWLVSDSDPIEYESGAERDSEGSSGEDEDEDGNGDGDDRDEEANNEEGSADEDEAMAEDGDARVRDAEEGRNTRMEVDSTPSATSQHRAIPSRVFSSPKKGKLEASDSEELASEPATVNKERKSMKRRSRRQKGGRTRATRRSGSFVEDEHSTDGEGSYTPSNDERDSDPEAEHRRITRSQARVKLGSGSRTGTENALRESERPQVGENMFLHTFTSRKRVQVCIVAKPQRIPSEPMDVQASASGSNPSDNDDDSIPETMPKPPQHGLRRVKRARVDSPSSDHVDSAVESEGEESAPRPLRRLKRWHPQNNSSSP